MFSEQSKASFSLVNNTIDIALSRFITCASLSHYHHFLQHVGVITFRVVFVLIFAPLIKNFIYHQQTM